MPFDLNPGSGQMAARSSKATRTIDIGKLEILPEKKARKNDKPEVKDLPNPTGEVLQMDWTCLEWFCVTAIAHEVPTRKSKCSTGVLFNQVCFSDAEESKELRLAMLSYAQGGFNEEQAYQQPFKWTGASIRLGENRVTAGHDKVFNVNPKLAQEYQIEKHPHRTSKDVLLQMLSDLKTTIGRNGRLCMYDIELEGGIIHAELERLGEDTSRWDDACRNGMCLMDPILSNWAFGPQRKFAFVESRELFEFLLGRQAALTDPGKPAAKCWQVLRKMHIRVRQHVKVNLEQGLGSSSVGDPPNAQRAGRMPKVYRSTAKAIPPTLAARQHFKAETLRYVAIFVEVHKPFRPGKADWRPGQFGFDLKVSSEDMQTMRASRIAWACGDVASQCPEVKSRIVRPDGFRIVDDESSRHRVSHAEAMQDGTALEDILGELLHDLLAEHKKGSRICAHQIEHAMPPIGQDRSSCVCVCD